MSKTIADCVILHVEDNDATAFLFQMALRESRNMPQLFRVSNGRDAISYLMNAPPYEDAPKPDLIVLDVNLPGGQDGFEILAFIRATPHTSNIPVYVLTTSTAPKDRAAALAAGAQGILNKGSSLDEFADAAKSICSELQ